MQRYENAEISADVNEVDVLDLSHIKIVTRQEIERIKEFTGYSIKLGIEKINGTASEAIDAASCELDFVALTTFDEAAANHFSLFKGEYLSFSGLEAVSASALKILLTHFRNTLSLGLPSLNSELARVLGESDLLTLYFSHLRFISKESACWLNKSGAILNFEVLESIDPETAEALLKDYWNPVSFGKLQIESIDLASALALHPHDLFLGNVVNLSEGIAKKLLQHKGALLDLSGLKSMSLEAAREFASDEANERNPSSLWLGLDILDVELAGILSQSKRGFSFMRLQQMSDEVAQILSNAKCQWLNFSDQMEMSQTARDTLFSFQRNLNLRDQVTHL